MDFSGRGGAGGEQIHAAGGGRLFRFLAGVFRLEHVGFHYREGGEAGAGPGLGLFSAG